MFACSTLFLTGNVGVPIKLLHEAEGMKVTVEVSTRRVLNIDLEFFTLSNNSFPILRYHQPL